MAGVISVNLSLELLSFGLLLASVYALLSTGLVLVFSIVDIPNFAQAGIYMVGGYVGYLCFDWLGVPAIIGIVPAFVVGGLVGAVLWYGVFQRLMSHPRADMFVSAFGALVVLQSGSALIFGASSKGYPVIYGSNPVLLNVFPADRLWVIGVTVVIALLLLFLIEGTLLGKAMRGVAQNRFAADALGMNSGRIALIALVLGSGLGGVAGALLGGITGVNPTTGAGILLRVFAILVIGGMGSLRGAVVASVVMGVAESVIGFYWSAYTDLFFFTSLFVILLIRPHGFFGDAQSGVLEAS